MNRPAAAAILALFGLCGCQANHELAVAQGPVFPLNPGRWAPSAQDLQLAPSKAGTLPVAPPASPPPSPLDVGPKAPTPAFSAAAPVELGR